MPEATRPRQDRVPFLEVDQLQPFVSLILLQSSDSRNLEGLFQRVLKSCVDLAKLEKPRKRARPAAQPKVETSGAIQAGAVLIEEITTPSWTAQTEIEDVRHHLIVVLRLGDLFAIHTDDPALRRRISAEVGNRGTEGLGTLAPVNQGRLNAAFVQGITRTVWLRGIHHPTSLKSDTKMLSGSDLGDVISPLADQTYHFTAVRCAFDDGDFAFTIGVAPAESRIWIARARDWETFKTLAIGVLTRVAETTRESFAPIRFLAVPGAGGIEVEHAFDIGFYVPEVMDASANDPEMEARERVARRVAFKVIATNAADVSATILRDGEKIGTVQLHFMIEGESVTANATAVADLVEDREEIERIQRYCEDGDMLVVRYDSEHVISGGMLYRYRFRDHPFSGYEWADLAGWTITAEKPSSLDRIGNEHSLFDWAWRRWSRLLDQEFGGGWLACDDGAGEKADFIHFDEEAQALSLIHIKACVSSEPTRSVAVAPYEVVVSQAVKNLRFLDRENLQAGLVGRLGGSQRVLTWKGGNPCTRDDFMNAIARIQPRCTRSVVIVQPHLQQSVWARATARPESQEGKRLRQLNTLLVSADSSCRDLGANLIVVGPVG